MVKRFLLINKGMLPPEVYECDTLEEAARIAGVPSDDISWQLKRTGRWDREDAILTLIESQPPSE